MLPLSLRLKLVKALIAIAFLAGFLLSPALWHNEGRSFPLIKPLDVIPTLPAPFDMVLLLLFMVSCITWIFYKKKVAGIITVAGLLIILAQDQMRWQPWVYIYLLLLLPYLFRTGKSEDDKMVLNYLQWIIAGIYIWSGLQKLNINFIEGPFVQMIKDFGMEDATSGLKKLGYFIPLIEIFMGISLLIPKVRKIGIGIAIAMHIFILFYLSQIALIRNSIVYPWNGVMILFVVLIFGTVDNKPFSPLPDIRLHPLRAIPLALVWVFPLFNLFGFWDHYLAFSFYSNKPCQYYIAIKEGEIPKIDSSLNPYFVKIEGLEGGKVIEVNRWALGELNVPFYPEKRLFKKLGSSFCRLNIPEGNLFFVELTYIKGEQQFKGINCSELNSR